jgi:hypothetical protein
MILLYPDFLWALLLNIIPIFIHLFNLQKHETIYFSDVSLLKKIEEKTKRKSQLKNILLLISRILFISSLVIAFCFPYKKDQKIDLLKDLNKVGIYIDNSFSMSRSYQNQTLLESAKDDAIKLIDNLPDETKYVLTTNIKKNNKQYLIDNNEIKKEIINLKTTAQTLTISEAIEIQHEQLKLENLNSFWFTDLQENTMDLDKIKDKRIIENINILQYSSSSSENISIDSVWFNKNNRTINNNENLNVKITNHSAVEVEFQTKLNINNGEVLNQSFKKINPKESAIIKFEYSVREKGIKSGLISLINPPNNDLLFDDKYFFSYILEEKFSIVNIHQGGNQSNKPVETLFKSVEKTNYKNIDINNGVNEQDLNAELIVLNELTKIDEKIIQLLLSSSKRKSILIFPSLSGNIDYKDLYKILGIKSSELVNLKSELDIESIDLSFFKNIFSNYNENLDLPYFKKYLKIKNLFNPINYINLSNAEPLVSKYSFKNNDFYFFTSNLNKEYSNLGQHALFVPILLRIKEKSANDITSQISITELENFKINQAIPQNGNIQITNDLNEPTFSFFPLISSNSGSSSLYIKDMIESTGQYFVYNNDSLVSGFSVNNSNSESKMAFASSKELNYELENLDLNDKIHYWDIKQNKYPELIKNKNKNLEYWIYFIFLSLICLILEIIIIKKLT